MMIDCRQVKLLLPLWVGQDLPDVTTTLDVSRHLQNCPACEEHRKSLQASLEVLQGVSSVTLVSDASQSSLLPRLSMRISDWENRQHRDRFHGWLPATVMALAVAAMVSVSIPSILQEIYGDHSAENVADLFQSDQGLEEFRNPEPSQTSRPHSVPVVLQKHPANQW
jgi:predicted anti-sigma-YlaC factor YlaD